MRLGARDGDRLVIEVLGRMHAGAVDFWDGNWLFSPVDLVVGGFTARVPAGLRAEELRSFRKQLAKAYADFGGVARLTSMEEWLDLTVTVAGSGARKPLIKPRLSAEQPVPGGRLA
ncbi:MULTISPECIES: hypothetical protein [Actinomycetes]|uniref:WapI family immunity protein n=1 Tax=Actinomycetes TaxID=1760 RepID=UPI0018F8AEEB|nr:MULTISPECIES: hypothetical protein [Actinomycetes]